MTHLPQTVIAEAQTYADTWFAEIGNLDIFGLGIPTINASTGQAWLRRELKTIALAHPRYAAWLIENARAGWDDADIVLRELAIEIGNRGEPVPTALSAYTAEATRLPRPRGPRKTTYAFQDIIIAGFTADLVERFNLKPTRSTLSKRRSSACDIVAEAVNRARIGRMIAYKDVERLWTRWGKWLLPESRPLAPLRRSQDHKQ